MEFKNILVVGGCGYVGGAITDYYQKYYKDKIHLHVYDIMLYEESYRKDINFIYGDIRNTEYIIEVCNKYNIDAVIWLAAIVGDQACDINVSLTKEINTKSLERFINRFKGKIVFLSSCSTYGIQKNDELLTENDETNPVSLYASTKLDSEKLLNGTNSIVFRMGTLFGIADDFSRIRFDLVINKLVLNAIKDNHLLIFGGKQYRPFLHVRDAAKIIFESIFIDKTGIFNIACKNEKIENLVSILKKFFKDLKLTTQPMDFQDTRNYKVDTSKAIKDLNFRPDLTIEDGIEEIKELLEEKRIKNLNSFRYNNFLFLSDGLIY